MKEIVVNPDKSISHRAIFFSSLAKGKSVIIKPQESEDLKATKNAMRKLGVKINQYPDRTEVFGFGIELEEPDEVIFCGNSGTTARVLIGILSGQKFVSVVDGDDSLRKRPMMRVVEPLRKMGAKIWGRDDGNLLPIVIEGGEIEGGEFEIFSSAQVKTSLLITNFWSKRKVYVKEKILSRDHTERLLPIFGVEVKKRDDGFFYLEGYPKPAEVRIPGDISSASFFIAYGILKEPIKISDVLINPTRTGFIDVLISAGAKIVIENRRIVSGEDVGDIIVEPSEIKGIKVGEETIPRVIDEIPILAMVGIFAEGETIVRGARELRVKESDRINAITTNLKNLGVNVEEFEDGFRIVGMGKSASKFLKKTKIQTFSDHRIAMSFYVLKMVDDLVELDDEKCVSISFPEFFDIFSKIKNQK